MDMKIKSNMRCHLTSVRVAVDTSVVECFLSMLMALDFIFRPIKMTKIKTIGENVEKRSPLYMVAGNANCSNSYGGFFENSKSNYM